MLSDGLESKKKPRHGASVAGATLRLVNLDIAASAKSAIVRKLPNSPVLGNGQVTGESLPPQRDKGLDFMK